MKISIKLRFSWSKRLQFQTRIVAHTESMAPPVLVSGALEDAAALDRARKLEIWRAQKAAAAADKVPPPRPSRIPQWFVARERRARLLRFLGSWGDAARGGWRLQGGVRRWCAGVLSRGRGGVLGAAPRSAIFRTDVDACIHAWRLAARPAGMRGGVVVLGGCCAAHGAGRGRGGGTGRDLRPGDRLEHPNRAPRGWKGEMLRTNAPLPEPRAPTTPARAHCSLLAQGISLPRTAAPRGASHPHSSTPASRMGPRSASRPGWAPPPRRGSPRRWPAVRTRGGSA